MHYGDAFVENPETAFRKFENAATFSENFSETRSHCFQKKIGSLTQKCKKFSS